MSARLPFLVLSKPPKCKAVVYQHKDGKRIVAICGRRNCRTHKTTGKAGIIAPEGCTVP